MLEWELRKFKRMFPNLKHEMEGTKIPTVLDHFEKCRDEKEALEIVDFFEREGDITEEMANYLRANISKYRELFGTRKAGDYERRGLER
jgi:hypothetical protein